MIKYTTTKKHFADLLGKFLGDDYTACALFKSWTISNCAIGCRSSWTLGPLIYDWPVVEFKASYWPTHSSPQLLCTPSLPFY